MNSIPGLRILPAEAEFTSSIKASKSDQDFGDMLQDAVRQVDQLQWDASVKVADLLTGQGGDVHSAMIAVEKADLTFQLMMQVRNKVVQAYQEISRMQF
jgi:flagellar hook-basal body complex protein FliE